MSQLQMQPSFWNVCLAHVPPPTKNTTLNTRDFPLPAFFSSLNLGLYCDSIKLTAWYKCNFRSVSVHMLARRKQLMAYLCWRESEPERKSSTPGLISCSTWLVPPRLSGRAVFSLYTGWNQNGFVRPSPGCVWSVSKQIGLQEARLESIISSFKTVSYDSEIKLSIWLCLEISTQDEVTVWRLIIVPLKGWKRSNIWEQR